MTLTVCRYELMFGKRPFRGRTNTALTNAILHETLTWPDDAAGRCSTEGMHAIRAVSPIHFRSGTVLTRPSCSSATQIGGWDTAREEAASRISSLILGSQVSTGMRYTRRRSSRLSSQM